METWSIAAAVALVIGGCKHAPVNEGPADGGGEPPRDHLAPGEIPEGLEKAFALPLPRASRISARYPDSVLVTSTVPPEDLANFVRARVKSGKSLVGATMTTFEGVVVPAEPTRQLTVEVRSGVGSGARSTMIVRDVTVGAPAKLSPEDAWKKAGMSPDGKLLDPNHTQ